MQLKDKVAFITGASRGIGQAIAVAMAKEGAKIVINYSGNEALANDTLAMVREAGSDGIVVRGDVSNAADVTAMVAEAHEKMGRIDILVNNAGVTRDGLLMRMKEEDWDFVLDINLKGTFLVTKEVSRIMMKQRYGRIINISSVSGVMGNIGQANYSASKAGVIGFTKTCAREFASRGIVVNVIAPGFVNTDMTVGLPDAIKEGMKTQIPLGRMGEVEEIAKATIFFASEGASYVTGQVLHVDGGLVM